MINGTNIKVLYAWKQGAHYKIALYKNDKRPDIKCIKKLEANWKLQSYKEKGWTIMIGQPGDGKHV